MAKNKFKTILELVGNTPLAKLEFGTKPTLLAKLEYLNPGGSLKDRSALFMITQAEKQGLLKPGGTIVEASSGNQGIALAMIGAMKGYKVIITVPDRTSKEKIAVLKAYGAEVHICPNTDSHHSPEGCHAKAVHFAQTIPNAFMPNQYFNKANPLAHYSTTGPEIWEQTNGEVTHVIMATGSCGTISGTAKYLKEKNPKIKIIGVDAATSIYSSPKNPKAYKAEGIGIDVISDTLDLSVIDEILPVTDDEIFAETKRLAKKGLLVGLSAGAVMHIALKYCQNLKESDIVVVILGDSGRAYLSKVFMDDVVETKTPEIKTKKCCAKNKQQNL